jgi:hypothetical protein
MSVQHNPSKKSGTHIPHIYMSLYHSLTHSLIVPYSDSNRITTYSYFCRPLFVPTLPTPFRSVLGIPSTPPGVQKTNHHLTRNPSKPLSKTTRPASRPPKIKYQDVDVLGFEPRTFHSCTLHLSVEEMLKMMRSENHTPRPCALVHGILLIFSLITIYILSRIRLLKRWHTS